MKVIIYGLNYSPELTGVGKYTGELGAWLADNGHRVNVITAPPYYPEWKLRDGYKSWGYQKIVEHGGLIFRVPIYVPANPTMFTRLIHLVSFSITSFPVAIRQIFWKPQIVLFIQPTLFASLGALFLARISGAKAVMHIQDYEIDAMFGLGIMRQNLLAKSVRRCESWIMKRFDLVTTISHSMMCIAKQKGVCESRLFYFPNWVDTEFVKPAVKDTGLKAEWGFAESDKIILYAGNVGKKQGLELVLELAERFREDTSLRFVIVGTGAHLADLKKASEVKGIGNVFFKPLLPWSKVPEMLNVAEIHLVMQKSGVADFVLPSKLTNILAVGGHVIVTANKDTELGRLENEFPGLYKRVEPDNIDLLEKALKQQLKMDLKKINDIAHSYVQTRLARDEVLSSFEQRLRELSEPPN